MHRWVPAAAVVVAIVLIVLPSQATQVLHKSLAELGSESQLVVQGRVVDVESHWNDAGTKILTDIHIEVDRSFKGDGADRVTVVQMGGVVDNVRMTVSGALAWSQNEEVVLFLEPSLPQAFRVAGFSQGKFSVERDLSTGRIFVTRPSLGIEIVDAKRPDGASRLPLDELLERSLNLRESGGE